MSDKKYYYGVGRRKRASARAKFYPGNDEITINVNKKSGKDRLTDYYYQTLVNMLAELGIKNGKVDLFINGGGLMGQAEAARLALAKALLSQNEELKPALKAKNYLTTDVRKVLPKRPGLRKARKREQWSKR